MQRLITGIKKFLPFILIFGLYLLVTIVIFKHRLLNIGTQYGMPDMDSDGTIWYFWARLFTEKNNLNFIHNNVLYSYPHGYDLTYIPFFSLIYEITIRLIDLIGFSWRNIILVVNTSLIFTYVASAFSAFLLAYYLTRSKYASLISGFIFGFSFYFILMGRGYLSLNHLEFIPLYYLSLFYYIEKKNGKSLVLSGLAFAIIFTVNSYYAFFSILLSLPILLVYKKDSIKEKIRSILIYYSVVSFLGILININFFREQFFVFDPVLLEKAGKVFEPTKQVVNLLSFFAPSVNNFAYKKFGVGNNFLGYTSLMLGLSGVFFIKRVRKYFALLVCFLLSILLASNIPNLFFINEIYFKLFAPFRAVSRLNILSSFFLSLMAALSVKYLLTEYKIYFNRKKLMIAYAVLVVICIFIVLEGLNLDKTWSRTTDFKRIAILYEPIRNNPDIKVIAGYPMTLSNQTNGAPPNYERLGQIIHGKSLVGGLSPFSVQANKYFNFINNIEKSETIDNLSSVKVDTIIIYKTMLSNSIKIIANLKKDTRLNYIGDSKAYYDDSTYISNNDLARNFSVFQIKEVVAYNKKKIDNKILIKNLGGGSYEYKKDSGTKYQVSLRNINSKINLVLDEPYSDKWKMYVGKNSFFGDISYSYKKDIYGDTHMVADIYKNGWIVDPIYIKQNFSKEYYKQNPDGSIDLQLTLFFKPQSYVYLGQVISWTTLISCLSYLIWSWARGKNGGQNKKT